MTTSPARSKPRAATTFIASLSMTSWPCCSSSTRDLGRHRDAQLAAGGEDVDGAVLEGLEEHAVAARRLGQPVDLLLERDHLVARLAQGLGQPLVAVGQRGDARLRLGEPLLEHAHVPRRLGDLRPQQFEFLLEERGAAAQVRVVAHRAIAVQSCRFARLVSHAATSRSRGVFAKSHPTQRRSSHGGNYPRGETQRQTAVDSVTEELPTVSEPLRVWIDQELCTGDGLCVQYAPEVFEFDVDGLAYVKDGAGDLLAAAGRAGDGAGQRCAWTSSTRPRSARATASTSCATPTASRSPARDA